jgi:hypothetical protein
VARVRNRVNNQVRNRGGWLVKKWVWYVLGVYCGHFGGVVGLKGAGHGGVDLKWAGHVGGVSLSHFGLKKFTQWYSVGLGGF